MSVPSRPSSWSTTFGQCLTVYHLLPFSLRVSFAWEDREPSPQDSERLVRGPPDRPLLKSFSWPRDSVPYGLSRTSSGARVPIFGPSTRRRPHSSTRISKPGFTIPSRSEVAAHVAGERHLACRRFLRRPDGLHRATSGTGPSPWQELLGAEEVACITGSPLPLTSDCILSCGALLVGGWDESLVAFAGRPSAQRDQHRGNSVEFFTLGAMHWMGLYDTNQLLYDAVPFLFQPVNSYRKLQLLRGVQAHLAELQHESKLAYLAEHEDDRKILSRMFESWETENLVGDLEKKSTMLTGIVDRLNDDRLRQVGVFFTGLSLIGIVSNFGQPRHWDVTGVMWSAVAVAVGVIGGWFLLRKGRN